jgi:hypothetical protein
MKKWNRFAAAALASITLLAFPALAGDVKITKKALVIDGGQRFFRGKATDVALGSYGEKKTPITAPNYLAIEKTIPGATLAKVPVKITGPIAVDWSKVSKTEIEGGVNYLQKGGGKASLTVDSAKSAKLVLVKFSIAEGDLKDLLNNHANDARQAMKDEGKDARIVSEVYVAMEAELASTVTTGGSGSANGTVNGLEIEVKASGSNTTTTKVVLPPDTTFAYLLHRVKKWDGKRVKDMEDDQSGIN